MLSLLDELKYLLNRLMKASGYLLGAMKEIPEGVICVYHDDPLYNEFGLITVLSFVSSFVLHENQISNPIQVSDESIDLICR